MAKVVDEQKVKRAAELLCASDDTDPPDCNRIKALDALSELGPGEWELFCKLMGPQPTVSEYLEGK